MYMQILYQCIYNGFNLRPPNCQKIGKLQLPRWGLLKNALLHTLFTLQWGFKKICHCLQQKKVPKQEYGAKLVQNGRNAKRDVGQFPKRAHCKKQPE